jgi:putative oxidoreductase
MSRSKALTVESPAVRDIPRTEDELGLEPQVPTVGEHAAGTARNGVGRARHAASTAQRDAATARHDADIAQRDAATARHDPDTTQHDTDTAGSEADMALQETGTAPHEVGVLDDAAGHEKGAAGRHAAGPDTPAYPFASIPPAPPPSTERRRTHRRPETGRGTTDFGLLGLRLVVGLTFLYYGLQKLAGWFNGPGLDGTQHFLEHGGWKHVGLSAALLTVSEVGGGALIVLGLATPLAAGAVLASITDAWLWKLSMRSGVAYAPVELESILAGLSAALILTGPGRWSFDRNRGWATRPFIGSIAALVLALAAAAGGWIYLHGGNPFH